MPANAESTVLAPFDRRRLLGIAAAVWLSFGLVQCLQSFVYARAVGRAWSLSGALVTSMPWWLSWLVLTPVIALLADRFPFSGGRQWRSLGMHAAAAVALSSVHLMVVSSIYWLTTGRFLAVASSLPNQVQRFFGAYFLEAVVTYGGAAGVLIAIDFARAVRDETVARARLEAQAAALESSVNRARLDALTMEINPHFLFNTLSAIAGLVGQDRKGDAREMIQRLGELLRRTLGVTGPFNSVAREVELLEDYLYIQRVRFSDRLCVELVVDDSAANCLIPSMLLQPLVENAIRHGIEPREGPGVVRIRIERQSASLRVAISDSGGGFSLGATGRPSREGIGISNTRARLQHLYGADARLILQNAAEGGAQAVVTMPASEKGANGAHGSR